MAQPVSVPNKKIGGSEISDLHASSVYFPIRTTRPTTGLTKGEMFLLFHGSTPKIGVCTSTVGQTIKLIRLRTKTFGRLTA